MDKRESYSDRRRFARVAAAFTVFYRVNSPLIIRIRIGDKEVGAVAIDISEGGMSLLTSSDMPPLGIVTMNFTMLNEKALSPEDRRRSTVVRGEVRYCVYLKEQKAYRLGIEYNGLTSDERRFIAQFVKASK